MYFEQSSKQFLDSLSKKSLYCTHTRINLLTLLLSSMLPFVCTETGEVFIRNDLKLIVIAQKKLGLFRQVIVHMLNNASTTGLNFISIFPDNHFQNDQDEYQHIYHYVNLDYLLTRNFNVCVLLPKSIFFKYYFNACHAYLAQHNKVFREVNAARYIEIA